jgi:hypothetical protein
MLLLLLQQRGPKIKQSASPECTRTNNQQERKSTVAAATVAAPSKQSSSTTVAVATAADSGPLVPLTLFGLHHDDCIRLDGMVCTTPRMEEFCRV